MLKQTYLSVVRFLLRHIVHVPVDRALADTRLHRKLVNRLVEVFAHVAAHCVRRHPGWAGYMVACELLPDTLRGIDTNVDGDPFEVVSRKVVDCKGVPDAHSVSQI